MTEFNLNISVWRIIILQQFDTLHNDIIILYKRNVLYFKYTSIWQQIIVWESTADEIILLTHENGLQKPSSVFISKQLCVYYD